MTRSMLVFTRGLLTASALAAGLSLSHAQTATPTAAASSAKPAKPAPKPAAKPAATPVPKVAAEKPGPDKSGPDKKVTRSTSIPATGLFVGDQLSASTKSKLTELILDSIGQRIEMALLVPTGPWKIDGAGKGDTNLTSARLQSLRRFLTDRGVDPKKIFVESRTDAKIKTPRLDVQLITSPAND